MPRRSLKSIAAGMAAKMECLWKPAQSGKTRTIQEMIRADDGVRAHLNIVVCSNNRLLVAQTRSRMDTDLYAVLEDDTAMSSVSGGSVADDVVVGGVYSWMSGTKKTNISVRDLAWRVFRGEVSMIVCCSHKARFRYLNSLLAELEAAGYTKPVNVWIDEADASVKTWASPEFDFAKYGCVRKVTLVSATFDEVFRFYDRIKVKAFPETHPECYRGLKDCDIVEEENCMSSSGFLASMLTKYPALASPRMRLFAPGDITVESHEDVAAVLAGHGFAILMLNGQEKGFRMPDGTFHEVVLSAAGGGDPDELSRTLAAKYVELGLERFPFAVTGHLCLSRGITFQSPGFLFDAGVVPDISDAASAYQCVARVLGNVGGFSDSKPLVLMSPAMKAATTRQERIAVNLARLVHENEWADVGKEEVERASFDSEEEYRAAREAARDKFDDEDFECVWHGPFNSLDEAKAGGWGKRGGGKPNEAGFYRNRMPGRKHPMTPEEYERVRASKKTWLAAPPHGKDDFEVDVPAQANFVYYTDPTDPTTARFVYKVVTRRRAFRTEVDGPVAAGGGRPE
jgi:hypothetical protein